MDAFRRQPAAGSSSLSNCSYVPMRSESIPDEPRAWPRASEGKPMDKQEITKYIGQHSAWKSRLKQAIQSGSHSWDLSDIRSDGHCEVVEGATPCSPLQRELSEGGEPPC